MKKKEKKRESKREEGGEDILTDQAVPRPSLGVFGQFTFLVT